ncbi:MAG: conjugal transfer protein TraL [Neisseriaceae bacterium]|nr:conjugal transfer protein TraL [Neisseriaceae bacterium]
MKQAHFIVQGKGGVGKSLIASMLAQYLTDFSGSVISCFDTDPVNPTFSRYQALNVETINILNEQNDINKREFDTLVERLLSDDDGVAVVDNGAATFIPLMSYFMENDLVSLLAESGVEIIFHVPLYGGDAFEDTLKGLSTTLKRLSSSVVVWLNHNQNKIVFNNVANFTDTKIYKGFATQILGIVELKQHNAETFGVDIKEMTQRHLTVAEVKANADKRWKLTEIQRINLFYKDICEQLHQIPLFAESTTE